jgi:hypothetical protein
MRSEISPAQKNFVLKTVVLLACLLTVVPAYATDNPLQLFKNYFVTGDYVSDGVGLRGQGQLDKVTGRYLAAGKISVPVPEQAEIVAAFLYWETNETTAQASSAKGYLLDPAHPYGRIEILGKPIGRDRPAPCWIPDEGEFEFGGVPILRVYRADILRYLQVDDKTKRKVPNITVLLPDSGSIGGVPATEGASLVVIYRRPDLPFKSIVIFDGSFTASNYEDSLNQTLYGFYQASTYNPVAKITHIVAGGQKNSLQRLSFNGVQIATNPFVGTRGNSWDDLTYEVGFGSRNLVPAGAASVSTRVDQAGFFNCLAWSAILFSTTVQDTDEDGLLDIWEAQGFKDLLTGAVLVNLPRMGANPLHKDIFVESDYMQEFVLDSLSEAKGLHSHKFSKEVIDRVGNAFNNAPVRNPDGIGGIRAHFDVQNPGTPLAERYAADPFIIPAEIGEGGDVVNERSGATFCTTYSVESCQFPNQPGLVSWKKGFQHIKQAHVPGLTKVYFSHTRNLIFHYALAAHALAMHQKDAVAPFLAASFSGRGDLCGRDFVVSLGLWKMATDITVASTLLHELAHTLCGYHGGTPDGLNCKPNYESVLNYMYQAMALLDRNGNQIVDLSRQNLPAPLSSSGDESVLNEADGLGVGQTAYQLRWYAPLDNIERLLALDNPDAPNDHVLTAARAHCDGTPLLPGETPAARRDAETLEAQPIDWNSNDVTTEKSSVDINYNGQVDPIPAAFGGHNDWESLVQFHGLQQVASGRNLFGLSLLVTSKDLLQSGEADLGEADLGEADLGEADLGEADLGEADLGEADLGEADLGSQGLGEADLGASAEIDEATAASVPTPPSGLVASLLTTGDVRGVQLTWNAPAFGVVTQYTIYRSTGRSIVKPLTVFGPIDAAHTTFVDTTVANNTTYTYYVLATSHDEGLKVSGPTNRVTITVGTSDSVR